MTKSLYRPILLSFFISLFHISLLAQPPAVKKAADAVVSLTTFKADGSLLGTAQGVIISQDGIVVAPWKPFAGAERASVIDSKGVKHEVCAMMGANEIYDMAKFRIDGNVPASLTPSTQTAAVNTQVWIVPNKKSNSPIDANIQNVETFMEHYAYYLLNTQASNMQDGCPVIDANGRLIGLFNGTAKSVSATDVRFAQDFKLNGMSLNDPTLRQTQVRIGLPTDESQAQLALMFAGEYGGEKYEATVEDFITLFPTSVDGHVAKARLQLAKGDSLQAISTMDDAIKKVNDKSEAHFQYARLLMQMDRIEQALQEVGAAYELKSEPTYKQLEAQLLFMKGEYQAAYNQFISLTHSPIRNGELFYQAMQAKEQIGGNDDELLALLDSAIAVCDTPYTVVTAPYFLARALQHDKMAQYRKALPDFYTYEALMYDRLNSDFYYIRSQSETKGRIYQAALNDIAHAVALDPKNVLYWAELASLNLRVNKYEEAILSARRCIEIDPNISEAYLIMGLAEAESGKKAEGLEHIKKAQSLGNEQAATFLEKYR